MLHEMSESVTINSVMYFLDCMVCGAEVLVCPVILRKIVSWTVLMTVCAIVEVLTERGHTGSNHLIVT